MGNITKKFETTCVCGTHGKTTTSLMIYEMLSKSLIEKYQKIHLFVKLIFVIILFSLKNV